MEIVLCAEAQPCNWRVMRAAWRGPWLWVSRCKLNRAQCQPDESLEAARRVAHRCRLGPCARRFFR